MHSTEEVVHHKEPLVLPESSRKLIQAELKRYEARESALIPSLYEAQKVFGWISPEVIDLLSKEMDIPTARVNEVAQFYTMFNKSPVGKYHVQVCTNIGCAITGGREALERFCKQIGVSVGETSKDGRFTVSAVECLGSCGTAPMAQINDKYYENLTFESIDKLVKELR
jgi:NADH-quinone oxidoreductase subunit E